MLGHQEKDSVKVQPEIMLEDQSQPEIDPVTEEINKDKGNI